VPSIIEINDLSFSYVRGSGEKTLRDINVEIGEGEFVLLAGRSGSGKSTLLRCINGLIPHRYYGTYEGEVYVKDLLVSEADLSHLSQVVGTVMQEVDKQLIGATVEDDIAFGPCNLNLPLEVVRQRVDEALKLMRISHLRDRELHALSGGEKQRVAIAGIMAMNPEIFLFDEPLANLDSDGVRSFTDAVSILRSLGKTIIVAEHRTDILAKMDLDRVMVIEKGELLENTQNVDILYNYKGIFKVPLLPREKKKRLRISYNHKKADSSPVIIFENVSYEYPGGVKALRNVSFQIYEGEKVALLGNNGAGKSTIALLTLGILKPTDGRVTVYGYDTRTVDVYELARYVGYVFQNPYSMLFAKTVKDELSFGPRNLGVEENEIEERVERIARRCHIDHLVEESPFSSSFGEKKRICLGSILTMYPKILFMDEPNVGQDYANYTDFMDFIISLHDIISNLVLITHETDMAIEYTDRTIVLSNGEVIADGPTHRVLADIETLERGKIRITDLVNLGRELTGGKYVLPMKLLENYNIL